MSWTFCYELDIELQSLNNATFVNLCRCDSKRPAVIGLPVHVSHHPEQVPGRHLQDPRSLWQQ